MAPTSKTQVGDGFGASNRVRLDVVELQEMALATAPPLWIDKGALTCVPFEYRSPDASSGLSPAIACCSWGTIGLCDGTASRNGFDDASWIRIRWMMVPLRSYFSRNGFDDVIWIRLQWMRAALSSFWTGLFV